MRFISLFFMLSVGCAPTVSEVLDSDVDTDTDTDTDTVAGPGPDLSERGTERAVTDSGTSSVRDDCDLVWTRYSPGGQEGEVLVVLAHGFARNQAQMKGWAEHLASWGAEVVTPDLCFASFIRTDHPANGRSIADLATELAGDRPIILAGHSAGGLAATLAADELGDRVAGVLLLDPVDTDSLGAKTQVQSPVGALFAEPSRCNSDGNGADMLPSDADAFDIEGANHCSFENPSDRICTSICGRDPGDEDGIRDVVLSMGTGFVHWHGGIDARGQDWWTPGSEKFESFSVGVTPR